MYVVYIMASRSHQLYIGLSSNIHKRVWQHKNRIFDGFTCRYNVDRLVYFENFEDVRNGIDRERQLKRWSREKKIALIQSLNPTWQDLSEGWYKSTADPSTRARDVKSRPRSG